MFSKHRTRDCRDNAESEIQAIELANWDTFGALAHKTQPIYTTSDSTYFNRLIFRLYSVAVSLGVRDQNRLLFHWFRDLYQLK